MAETTDFAPPSQTEGNGASGASDLKEQAAGRAEQAKERAQDLAGNAGSQVRQQVDQRSTQAGERISSTGSDLRSVGEELRKQGKDAPAKVADSAAQRVERVGEYLKQSDADRLLHDVEDLGRRQPLAVLAGGMVVGAVLARFLKASSGRRYSTRMEQSPQVQALPAPTPVAPVEADHSARFEPHP